MLSVWLNLGFLLLSLTLKLVFRGRERGERGVREKRGERDKEGELTSEPCFSYLPTFMYVSAIS